MRVPGLENTKHVLLTFCLQPCCRPLVRWRKVGQGGWVWAAGVGCWPQVMGRLEGGTCGVEVRALPVRGVCCVAGLHGDSNNQAAAL